MSSLGVSDLMPTDKPRLMVVVDEEMLKKIDDLRFERRYASRSQLMYKLLKLGIQAMEQQQTRNKKDNHPLSKPTMPSIKEALPPPFQYSDIQCNSV